MIMPELTEQASSEESLPETGMIGASDLFPVSTTANEESDRPLVIALYSSVGSGHRSAAASTAEAFARLRGNHPLVPEERGRLLAIELHIPEVEDVEQFDIGIFRNERMVAA